MTQENQQKSLEKNEDLPQPQEALDDKGDSAKEGVDEASLKRIIEAIIFASNRPVSIQQIRNIVEYSDTRVIRRLINELKQEHADTQRSFNITEVAGGFQFCTDPTYGRWLRKLFNIKQSDYLTGPSLETLAIIAYRQPATRADIESIRGVNVDGVVNNLLQKGHIRIVGKKEVVGRPFLYGTTDRFLQYFGLNSLKELPALPEFQEADLKFQKKPPEAGGGPKDEAVNNETGDKSEKATGITQEDR